MLSGEIISKGIKHIRDGYVAVDMDISELEKEILSSENVVSICREIETQAGSFVNKYMETLQSLNDLNDVGKIKEEMYTEIMEILQKNEFIDEYDGYQIVADIWNNSLAHDAELIAGGGFYEVGRMREPRMVTKGSGKNKREEQDGWNGVIVSNELVKTLLYKEELDSIDKDKTRLQAIEDELVQMAESAMEEDSAENSVLFDALKKNEDGEAQSTFESKSLKAEIKKYEKKTSEYELLKKVDNLLSEKSTISKNIKSEETELVKKVEDRIETLTDSEIDELMRAKWFGTFVKDVSELANQILKSEIEDLKMLHNRYGQTMDDIDEEIDKLMDSFRLLEKELVVM